MPLPASVPTGTVSGTWYTPSGNLAVGEIIFLLLNEIEVPDDADGVVLPLRTEVNVPAGQLNITLPAGYYNVLVRLSELYKRSKVIQVVAGQNINLPDAIDVVPVEDLVTPVRSVNGVLPDSSGNIEIDTGGGGGGAVSSVFGRTGAVTAQNGDYTKAQVGLSNVDNTSDASKPISTATQTALDGKAATAHTHIISNVTGLQAALDAKEDDGVAAGLVTALEATLADVATSGLYSDLTGAPAVPEPSDDFPVGIGEFNSPGTSPDYSRADHTHSYSRVKAFGTTGKITGTFGPGDTSGTWTVSPAQWRTTIAASVGDILCLDPSVIAQVTADAEMDVCSLNGNTPLRYYSSGTSTQAPNGHGGLYIGTQFSTELGSIRWVVTADDIVAGNVTLAYMYRAGSGVTWGSVAYPNEITLINEGKP